MDLYRAIRELYAEKKRLEEAIASLEQLLEAKAASESVDLAGFRKRRGRKNMPPEERKKVSERMRKYWAARRSREQVSARQG